MTGEERMTIEIISQPMTLQKLEEIAQSGFGNLVKAVVDVERGMMAIGGELHADEEALLLEHGSEQNHLWGINLYPAIPGDDFLEFDSMINIRPNQGNMTRSVEDVQIQEKIKQIVGELVK
jgi:hypothetical protein